MDAKLQLRIQRYGWDAAAPIYQDEWQQHLLSRSTPDGPKTRTPLQLRFTQQIQKENI